MQIKLPSAHASVLVCALAALALSGCSETLSGPSAKVAEIEPDTTGATSGNISSLTDVIKRNPNDPVAYNTHGIAYAKAEKFQSAIEDFSKAIQLDPHFAGAYTNRALAYRQIEKDGPALADSTPRSSPTRTTRRPTSGAATCCDRRAITRRRSTISTPRSGSILRARRPITRAG